MLLFHKQSHIRQIRVFREAENWPVTARREEQAGLLSIKDFASINPRKFVKSTPCDGLAAGLGLGLFKLGSGFCALVSNAESQGR